MLVLPVFNVNEAFADAIELIRVVGVESDSRAGKVLVAPYPVMTEYARPWQRVLFNPKRDANPFFHLFESLWMLAGRNDATWLDRFVSDFSKRFANDWGDQHGAYGYRWRFHFEEDQLETIIKLLKKNPGDRRVVIQMWDTWTDLEVDVKDVPCNTQIYPRIVDNKLDLTVMCRSNDIIWGAYGANAVHFSMLQEYLAGKIGCGIGKLYQFSNNWHAYVDVLDRLGSTECIDYYTSNDYEHIPIGDNWDKWDEDLYRFMDWTDNPNLKPPNFSNTWFSEVAVQMYIPHYSWKFGNKHHAKGMISYMPDCDWKLAAKQWMERRMK